MSSSIDGDFTVRPEYERVMQALADYRQTVVFQLEPTVYYSLGERFGFSAGVNVANKTVAALHYLGAEKVFDTGFAVDLLIMEQATEFIARLRNNQSLPLITTGCPAWVRMAEARFPDLLPHLSSCRSPQQMLGSMVKNYFAGARSLPPDRVFCVSVVNCMAKKPEAERAEFAYHGLRDVDAVITIPELAAMMRETGVHFANLPDEEFDRPFGESTGAAVSGGMMTAMLRTVHTMLTGDELPDVDSTEVGQGMLEFTLRSDRQTMHAAVVSGLDQAIALMEQVRRGETDYQLIEVMGCSAGCMKGISASSACSASLPSHCNEAVRQLYYRVLEAPNSDVARMALHTRYCARTQVEESLPMFTDEVILTPV